MLNSLIGKVSLGLLGGQASIPALGAVQNLAITSASGGEVADLTPEFTADAPVDDGYGSADSFTFQYADNERFNNATTITDLASLAYTIPTQPNATYIFGRWRGVRGGVDGEWSSTVSALILVVITRDDYTADAASVAGTRTPDGGGSDYTFTDSGAKLSIANHELTPTGSSTAIHDPQMLGSDIARAAGLTFSFRIKVGATGTAGNAFDFGACQSGNVSNLWGFRHQGGGAGVNVRFGGGTFTSLPFSYAAQGEYDLFDVVFFASSGAAVFVNKSLAFIANIPTQATLKGIVDLLSSAKKIPFIDRFMIYTNSAPLNSMASMALVNQTSPVSGTRYEGSGRAISQQMFTAEAGSLTSERGLHLRESAPVAGVDPDYWYVWLDASGNLKIQQFLAGVGQGTATTLASGILSAGASLGICAIAKDSKIYIYTYTTSNVYTYRGYVDDGVLNDNILVSPIAGNGTLGQLWCHPISSDVYNRLNPGFAIPAAYTADDYGEIQQAIDENALVPLDYARTYHVGELQEVAPHGNMRITTAGATDAEWDNGNWINWAVIHKDTIDNTYHNYYAGMAVFKATNVPNVEIDHVIIEGEYDPEVDLWLNAAAGSAIWVNGVLSAGWKIHHVVFRNLIGFQIEQLFYAPNWDMRYIRAYNCGNGINVFSPNGKLDDYTFDHAEGFEGGGSNLLIGSRGPVRGTNVLGGAGSFGGDQGVTISDGIIVDDFQADTMLVGNNMFAIVDNVSNIEIRAGVKAYRAPFGLNVQAPGVITGAKVIGMLAEECGQGFYLPDSSSCEVELDSVQAVNSTAYGLNCSAPDANVHGSSFTGSGNKDVLLQAGSAGMTFAGDNTYGTILDQR